MSATVPFSAVQCNDAVVRYALPIQLAIHVSQQ
jgi:hypothetical protein